MSAIKSALSVLAVSGSVTAETLEATQTASVSVEAAAARKAHEENHIVGHDDHHEIHSRAGKNIHKHGVHKSSGNLEVSDPDDKEKKEGEKKGEGTQGENDECDDEKKCKKDFECKKDDDKEGKKKCVKSSSSCFAGGALVQSTNGSMKISDLKIGDVVKTATGFEPIVGFLHAEEGAAEFVELTHPTGKLPVTGDHLIFLADGRAVTASSVKVGDKLSSGEVTNIAEVIRNDGIFAPMTKSGTIEVENTMASAYSSVNSMTHAVAHFATAPLRWLGVSPATTSRAAAYAPVFSS